MGWLLPVQQTRGSTGHRLTAEVRRARTVTAHLHQLFWSHIYLQRFQQQLEATSWTRSPRHATQLRSPACSRTSITVPCHRQDVCSHLDTFSQGCRAERQNAHPAAFLAAVLCCLCPHQPAQEGRAGSRWWWLRGREQAGLPTTPSPALGLSLQRKK